MLRPLKDIENFAIRATDGEIGHVKDFYFEDDTWVLRYFVVDTGTWLASRKVLVSPMVLRHPEWLQRSLPVNITREQVRNSPGVDTDQPVSRQNEMQMLGYYGYPGYWDGGGLWGGGLYPYALAPGYVGDGLGHVARERELEDYLISERARHSHDDPHLRSCAAVTGYRVQASDGDIGEVAGYLVDDETWAIRYLVVDTGHWWRGHQVLVAPAWIDGVHWAEQRVSTDLRRDEIQNAPPYDDSTDWGREQELQLHQHYGRAGDRAGWQRQHAGA